MIIGGLCNLCLLLLNYKLLSTSVKQNYFSWYSNAIFIFISGGGGCWNRTFLISKRSSLFFILLTIKEINQLNEKFRHKEESNIMKLSPYELSWRKFFMFLSCCNFVPFLQFVIHDPSAVLIYFGLFFWTILKQEICYKITLYAVERLLNTRLKAQLLLIYLCSAKYTFICKFIYLIFSKIRVLLCMIHD